MVFRNGAGRVIGGAILLVFGGMVSANAQFSPDGMRMGTDIDGANWYQINNQVTQKLEKVALGQLVRSQAKTPMPHDPAPLMERLDVFVRAGDRKPADLTIQALGHTALAQNANQSGQVADFLIEHGEWDLARHLMDACPLATPGYHDVFITHFEDSPSFPDLERWLAHRESLNPPFWSSAYLEYRRRMGTMRPLLDERAADVRAHPQDFAKIDAYHAAAQRLARRPNVAWLTTVCRFPLAVQNLEMGMKLRDWPDVAIPFLERALQIPITFDDYVWQEVKDGVVAADFRSEQTPNALRLQIESTLLERYQAVRDSEKAQKLQAEITAQQQKVLAEKAGQPAGQRPFGPGPGGVGAGIQAPAPENPVRENQEVYTYWLTRTSYFIAHKEQDQAEQAFQKALELSRVTPGDNDWNRIVVKNAYVAFLSDQKQPIGALKWLLSELDKAPIESDYARSILDTMFNLVLPRSPDLRPTNETFWRYLAARRKWEYQEARVLQELIDTAPGADHDPIWIHAEKLAAGNPDRERQLVYVMQVRDASARMIPVLQDIAQQTRSEADRHLLAAARLDAALAAKDWPQARALWPEARQGAMRDEIARWNAALLDAAVRANAYDDAMEFFANWTRDDYNRYQRLRDGVSNLGLVHNLANAGLRERLRRFYQNMAVADPNSHIPPDILPVIESATAAQANASAGRGPGGFIIESTPSVNPVTARALQHLSIDLTNLDLTTALQRVCDQAEISYVFALQGCKTQQITLSLKDIPLEQAFQRILASASPSLPLRAQVQRGFVTVQPIPSTPTLLKSGAEAQAEVRKARVTARFRNLSPYLALVALLNSLRISYALDLYNSPKPNEPSVQFAVIAAPAQDLLERIIKTSHIPLSHWMERDVFTIGLRDNAPE